MKMRAVYGHAAGCSNSQRAYQAGVTCGAASGVLLQKVRTCSIRMARANSSRLGQSLLKNPLSGLSLCNKKGGGHRGKKKDAKAARR